MKKVTAILLIVVLVGILAGCGNSQKSNGNKSSGTIIVGSKNFTENILLAHMMADLIEAHTDIAVTRKVNLGGSNVAWTALQNDEIQLYPDYTGTIVANYYQEETGTSEESLKKTRELVKPDGLAFLEPIGINNTYTLAVTKETADKYNLKTFSDLAKVSEELVLGVEFEFIDRADGYPGIRDLYDMHFKDSKGMDHGIMYRAISEGETDVTNAYSTDAQIAAHELVILKDDKEFFPPYDAGTIIRQDALTQYPDLEEVLNRLGGMITEQEMQALNAKVDIEGLKEETVARDFLIEKKLIES